MTDVPGEAPLLSGLQVVELGHVIAGPAGSQILAELGATVVKVEPPTGDLTRQWGPRVGSSSALFLSLNRNKRSVQADLRRPEEAAQVSELMADADVVICNLDRSMVEPAGLDAASVRARHPDIIYLEITGAGPGGPRSTDGLTQASMGLMHITGPEGGPGFRTGASVVDVGTGVWAALAVLAALERRRRTGRGDTVSLALVDVCLFMQLAQLGMFSVAPEAVRRMGNHSHIACTPVFSAADGRLAVSILSDRHWAQFCLVVERPDLTGDDRFRTNAARQANQGVIESLLGPIFGSRPRDDWLARLEAASIAAAPERTYAEVLGDESLRKRGILFEFPEGPAVTQVRLPVFFEEAVLSAPRLVEEDGKLSDSRVLDD